MVIFLISFVQVSYEYIFSHNFDNENVFSTKKTSSLTNFYDSNQLNWKNVEKHKTGYS
jgi:hypothetical protein